MADVPTGPQIPIIPSGPDGANKYIRTFHGDMEMLQKGGTPDLKPYIEKPVPTPTPPKAAQDIAPPKPEPPPQAPIMPPPSVAAPLPSPEPQVSPLQTYASDFSERVRQTKASTATILAAEQDAKTGEPAEPKVVIKESGKGGTIAVIAGVILVILGGAGAYIAYTNYAERDEPVAPVETVVPVSIFVDEREGIRGTTPAEILDSFKTSLARPLAPNNVRLLFFDTVATTTPSVFTALSLSAPDVLLRNVNSAGSIAGIVSVSFDPSPFFILSVATYSDTFAGMLQWEERMPRDVAALFPAYPESVFATATTTATTTTAIPIFSVLFHDEVVNNHDVRIYRDVEGRSILLYGYWDETTLIIARDPAAFSELIGRLSTARK